VRSADARQRKLTGVPAFTHRTDPQLRRALERWIAAEREAMTRIDAVRLAAEIGRLADEVLDQRVLEARSFHATWAEIAEAVGITRQSAHRRWRHLDELARALAAARQAELRSKTRPLPDWLDHLP
jgi:hypothetical protein